jgi:hypothetical protein
MLPTQPVTPLTREETAWLMRIIWLAMQAPKWTFQVRKDLEKFGEAIASGKELKDLDSALLDRIFPYLVTIINHLAQALKRRAGEPEAPVSREETAWLMRTFWKSLQAPNWAIQNQKDLEKLGEAIFSGKELKELGNKLLDRIFPHLVTVTNYLGAALAAKAEENDEPIAPVAPELVPTVPETPETNAKSPPVTPEVPQVATETMPKAPETPQTATETAPVVPEALQATTALEPLPTTPETLENSPCSSDPTA